VYGSKNRGDEKMSYEARRRGMYQFLGHKPTYDDMYGYGDEDEYRGPYERPEDYLKGDDE
jgi:hypothetical protein